MSKMTCGCGGGGLESRIFYQVSTKSFRAFRSRPGRRATPDPFCRWRY